MSENDWDVSKPIDHTLIADVPEKIRDVKSSAKLVIAKEHVTPSTDNAGGQHSMGSARVYLESAATGVDPEDNALDTSATSPTDLGRVAVLTGSSNLVKVYVATSAGVSTGWQDIAAARVYAVDTMDAGGLPITNAAAGTQAGQVLIMDQIDTTHLATNSTGLISLPVVGTYLAASGTAGITVLTSRDANVLAAASDTVFNTTLTAGHTWQDLDLSSYVGANTALCFFEIQAANTCYVAVKQKGAGSATPNYHGTDGNVNGVGVAVLDANKVRYLVSPTDSSGVVSIACNSNTVAVTIVLYWYGK